MMNKSRKKKLIVILGFILLTIIFLYRQNNDITITRINEVSSKIPVDFDGYKILQISDLHIKSFGKNQKSIVKMVTNEAPDLIVITGDLVDSKKYDAEVCLQLCQQLNDVAPIYFVTGNHEAWSNKFDEFETQLKSVGVNVLRNESLFIKHKVSKLLLLGVDDPDFQEEGNIEKQIDEMLLAHDEAYTILLSHRPELIEVYSKKNIDLVFSGHAHGGQFRLPIIGGIIAPNQGWLPQYTSGAYGLGNTTMIVSRGLGNSIIPQRLFNKPELVVVTLVQEKEAD